MSFLRSSFDSIVMFAGWLLVGISPIISQTFQLSGFLWVETLQVNGCWSECSVLLTCLWMVWHCFIQVSQRLAGQSVKGIRLIRSKYGWEFWYLTFINKSRLLPYRFFCSSPIVTWNWRCMEQFICWGMDLYFNVDRISSSPSNLLTIVKHLSVGGMHFSFYYLLL